MSMIHMWKTRMVENVNNKKVRQTHLDANLVRSLTFFIKTTVHIRRLNDELFLNLARFLHAGFPLLKLDLKS